MEELGYRMSLLSRSRKLQVILIWLSKKPCGNLLKKTNKNSQELFLPSAGEKGSSFNRSDKKDP